MQSSYPFAQKSQPLIYSGPCRNCKKDHVIETGQALQYGLELMKVLEKKKRIDYTISGQQTNPKLSTDYLFGEARGQMFGVMVCRDRTGSTRILKAFSCQFNGVWEVRGWVPPLFELKKMHNISYSEEKTIKEIGRQLSRLDNNSIEYKKLSTHRKSLSQKLQKNLHSLYELNNFCGEKKSLFEVFDRGKGIPTGTGDCCAPKLLNYAAKNDLLPLGIAEFYWGKSNKSGLRQHGQFYPSCLEKCHPILGFMLCGL